MNMEVAMSKNKEGINDMIYGLITDYLYLFLIRRSDRNAWALEV